MSQKSLPPNPAKAPAEAVVRDIRRARQRQYSVEDKIRIYPCHPPLRGAGCFSFWPERAEELTRCAGMVLVLRAAAALGVQVLFEGLGNPV
ncbi:MAG: hypothetical protein ACLPG5_01650 [Acidocella sp.]